MAALFPRFLKDPEEYVECEQYWIDLVNGIAAAWNQTGDWSRWIKPLIKDGVPLRDGNPICDGLSNKLNRAFRIIQYRHNNDDLGITGWVKDYPAEYTHLPTYELVLNLNLTDATSELAAAALNVLMNPETGIEAMERYLDAAFPPWLDEDEDEDSDEDS